MHRLDQPSKVSVFGMLLIFTWLSLPGCATAPPVGKPVQKTLEGRLDRPEQRQSGHPASDNGGRTDRSLIVTRGPRPNSQSNVEHQGDNTLGAAAAMPSVVIDPTDSPSVAAGSGNFASVAASGIGTRAAGDSLYNWDYAKQRIESKKRRLMKPGLKPPSDPAAAEEYFLDQRLPAGSDVLPLEQLRAALQDIKRREQVLSLQRGVALTANWKELGPGNIGGRTRSIVVNPVNPDIMYVGGVAGGVWKSTDAGASWIPTDDLMLNLAISTLVMDPTNPDILYAGTGEGFSGNPNGSSIQKRGLGIFKSTDAGTTWTQLSGTVTGVPTGAFYTVNQIVISPADSSRIYAATRFGVWKSTDAGTTWSVVLYNPFVMAAPAPSSNGSVVGCLDVAIRGDTAPGPDTLLAAFGSFVPDGLFRSTDSGATWVQVGTANDLIVPNQGRMEIAFAPSDNDSVYASMASNGAGSTFGSVVNVFRSTDGGVNWTPRLNPANLINGGLFSHITVGPACGGATITGQGWYDNVIAVDPLDPDIVWVGGIDLFRSQDGGQNFEIASYWFLDFFNPYSHPNYEHADHHALTFHPNYNGTTNQILYSGSDGGVAITENARAAASLEACPPGGPLPLPDIVWSGLNHGYGVTQFYHGDSAKDADHFGGGTQDNSTPYVESAITPEDWRSLIGGDGGYFHIDPTNSDILYGESQFFPNIVKSTDGGDSFSSAVFGITDTNGLFITPVALDQSDPNILWSGGTRPWRTTDGAASWTLGSSGFTTGGTMSAIAIAPSDSNVVYLGFNTGFVAKSTDALAAVPSWSEFTSANGLNASGFISNLAVSPDDPDVAYATYATFGVAHILRTVDGGQTWVSIDGPVATGVPDIPVHWIAIRPCNTDQLYLGTELGVFVSDDGGTTWDPFNTGFANVVVETLDFQSNHQLVAFSHGRGAFRTALDCPCNPASPILDCNSNGERDECDIASGSSLDCNRNGIPDECDLVDGITQDCNGNTIPDECDPDCNENEIPDDCDISAGTSIDCDASGVPDECENDCNENGVEDSCDIANGDSLDEDGDGIPDECVGACCFCGDCIETSENDCVSQQGSFTVIGVTCAASGCISGNDDCINAVLLPSDPELTVRFDNRCATTDGPAQVICDTGSQPLTGDLWYDYVAPCCGVLTVSMCNIAVDGMMAIYGGSQTCECPTDNSTLIGCGDDTCGAGGGPPVVSISVVKDGCYAIRAGGWNSATGVGDMTVSMTCVPSLTTQSTGHFDKDPGTGAYVDAGAYADVWADGDIVYQGQILDNKVNFFDVSDPNNPVRIREWLVGFPNTGSSAEDVKVGDELLFISLFGDGFDGVEIVDVRDPVNASHLSWITVPGFEDVKNSFYNNGYLYLANGTTPQLAVVDLTTYDPDAPPAAINAALWTINVGSSLVDNMTVADGRLYVAAGGSGVFVYDVTSIDSLAPQFLGSSLPQPATHSVGVSANGRWVVTTQRVLGGALHLFEIIPNGPGVDVILRQTIAPPATSTGYHNVVVDGMRVYTTLFETGLVIYEILPSAGSLLQLTTYTTYYQPFIGGFSGAWGVYPLLANDRVAVSDIQTGLHIVHVAKQNANFAYPNGLPDVVDPDVGTVFDVAITASCDDLDPTTASAFVRVGGDTEPFVEIPLTDLGNDLFEVALPPATCGSHVDYYLRIDTVLGHVELDPPLAPGVLYQAEVARTMETIFEDPFAADLGWTLSSFACFAGQVGNWQRVAPTPTFFAPGTDSPNDADGSCYVTGDGVPGGSPFTLDIDGGPYRMTSPVIPINGQDVRVSYDRWFFAQQRAGGISPSLIVDVSEDGLFWFTVESVETAGPRWIHHEFLLSDVMTPGESFQLRFSAADCPNKDVPEAAVDNVKMIATGCTLVDTPLAAGAPHDVGKNRYISVVPNNPGRQVKIEVTLSASLPHPGSLGDSWWVQPPIVPQAGGAPIPLVGPGECVAVLGPQATAGDMDWEAAGCQTLHVTGCAIEPTSEYDVRTVFGLFESDILTVPTALQPGDGRWWGDTVGIFDGAVWTPPQGVTNIDDAVVAIRTFQGGPIVAPDGNVAHLSVPDVDPGDINMIVNIADVFLLILAFQGDQYPFGPADSDGNCP